MKTVVYEKAGWHLEGDWPEDVPARHAYVMGGMLRDWLTERGLLDPGFVEDNEDDIRRFVQRGLTAGELFRRSGGELDLRRCLPRGT